MQPQGILLVSAGFTVPDRAVEDGPGLIQTVNSADEECESAEVGQRFIHPYQTRDPCERHENQERRRYASEGPFPVRLAKYGFEKTHLARGAH